MIPVRLRSQLIIVAALLVFFAPAMIAGRYFSPADILRMWPPFSTPDFAYTIQNPLPVDVVTQVEPWLKFSKGEFLRGSFPLWNPYAGAGVPLFANLQSSVLFPLNFLFYTLPWRSALLAVPFLKLYLISLFTYLYLRSLGLNRTASLFGGMNFAFLGFNVFWLKWPLSNLMIFLPLIFFFAEKFARDEIGPWPPMLLSLSVGAAALAGHIETLFHILVLAFAYLLWRVSISGLSWRQRAARVFLFGLSVSIGCGVAGVQLVPFVEYMYRSTAYATRSAHTISPYSQPLPTAILNLIPDFYGNPSHHDYFSTITNYCMSVGGYASVTTVFLALLTFCSPARRNRCVWFYLVTGALCFCMVYRREPVYSLLTSLPIFSVVDNSRLLFYLGFSICVLASLFIHSLTERGASPPSPSATALLSGALLAVAAWAAVYNRHFLESIGSPFRFSHNLTPTLLFLAFLALSVCMVLSCRSGRVSPVRCAAYLWLLVFLQTGVHAMGFNPSVPGKQYFPLPASLRFLKKDRSVHRCLFLGHVFVPNLGTWYGIQDPRSYDAMGIKAYRDFQLAMGDFEGIAELVTRFNEDMASFLNIRYIICATNSAPEAVLGIRHPTRYSLAYADRSVKIYENLACLPRAFIVPRVRVRDSTADILKELPMLDFRREALVTDADIPLWETRDIRSSSCRITSYTPRVVSIALQAAAPCYLLLSDSYFPGWRAYLDGSETKIYTANAAFRLVSIPGAGTHELTFRYVPRSFTLGLWISLLSLSALLGITLLKAVPGALKNLLRPMNSILMLSCGVLIVLICTKSIIFGSVRGNAYYPYLHGITPLPFLMFVAIAPLCVFLARVSEKHVSRFPVRIVLLWLIAGFLLQLLIRSLYPFSLGSIVRSDLSNSFYSPTLNYKMGDLLGNYTRVAPLLPVHARANMPGKIVLFYLLGAVTSSPQVMGYLIILLSNAGGVIVYWISRRLVNNRVIALYSLMLYLFIPARIFFFPILNTVTPVFLLVALLLFLLYLDSKNGLYLLVLGASLYVIILFEPVPLVMGIVFVALLLKYYREHGFAPAHLIATIAYPLVSLLLIHLIARRALGFDIIGTFLCVVRDAVGFNQLAGRSYGVWLIQNIKDFFIGAGCAQSVLFIAAIAGIALRRGASHGRTLAGAVLEPASLISVSTLLALLVLDIIGINRGEVTRLWIFLMVFLQMSVAHLCVPQPGRVTGYIVLLCSVLQTLVCISMIAFVYP